MSIGLTDAEVTEIALFLSTERLATFQQMAGSVRGSIELHQRVLQLGSTLAPIIAVIEIAVRNTVCRQMRTMFGVPDWLQNPPQPFEWKSEEAKNITKAIGQARRAAYGKKTNAEKKALDSLAFPKGLPAGTKHEAHVKKRQAAIQIIDGQVVAQLTLYFWKRLFSSDYEHVL